MNCCSRPKICSQTGDLPFVDGATPPSSPQGSVITDQQEGFTSSIGAACPLEGQLAKVQEPLQASSVPSNRTSTMATIRSPNFRAKAKESVSAALLTSFVPMSTLVGPSLSLPLLTVTVLDAVSLPQTAEEIVELFVTAVSDESQVAVQPLTKARSMSSAQQFVEKLQDKLKGFYDLAVMAIMNKVRSQMPEESCPETATFSVSNLFLDTTINDVVQSMLSVAKEMDVSEGKVCLDNISAVGYSGKSDDGCMEVSEAEMGCFARHICLNLLEKMKAWFASCKPAKVSTTGHTLTCAKEAFSEILVAVRNQKDNAQLKALAGAMLTKTDMLPEDQNNGADNKEEVEFLTLSVATSETLKADSTFSLEGRRLESSSSLSQPIAEVGSQGFSPDNFSAIATQARLKELVAGGSLQNATQELVCKFQTLLKCEEGLSTSLPAGMSRSDSLLSIERVRRTGQPLKEATVKLILSFAEDAVKLLLLPVLIPPPSWSLGKDEFVSSSQSDSSSSHSSGTSGYYCSSYDDTISLYSTVLVSQVMSAVRDPSSHSELDIWKPSMVPTGRAPFPRSSSSSSKTWVEKNQDIVIDSVPPSDSGVDIGKPSVVVPAVRVPFSDTRLTDDSFYTPSRDTVTTCEDVSTDSFVEAMQNTRMVPVVRVPSSSSTSSYETRLERNQESLTDSSFYTASQDTVTSEGVSTDSSACQSEKATSINSKDLPVPLTSCPVCHRAPAKAEKKGLARLRECFNNWKDEREMKKVRKLKVTADTAAPSKDEEASMSPKASTEIVAPTFPCCGAPSSTKEKRDKPRKGLLRAFGQLCRAMVSCMTH